MKILSKGILISIEGIDGSGKTTFAKNLELFFKNLEIPVILTKEPGGTEFGLKLRDILQNRKIFINSKTEFLLFATDRSYHFDQVIIPNLKEKKIVISDRLSDSSLAYQGYARGLDLNILKNINSWAMNNITPDLTIYIKIDLDTARERIKTRNESLTCFEKENNDFTQKVINGFDQIFKDKQNAIIVDGNKSQQEILQEATQIIVECLYKNQIIL